MREIYPLKIRPKASTKIWGGEKLKHIFPQFNELANDEPIGEVWLIDGDNIVENGLFAGETLQEVASKLGERLLGKKSTKKYQNKIPLLTKLIDSDKKLSIQVHPDDAYALTHEKASGHLGKAEAWYILEAKDGAEIIQGFKHELSKQEIREAIENNTLEQHLKHIIVKAGDIIYNPPGIVHAIGAGILLFEIQQASDLTYRLYDYNRRDSQGRPRELHIDKALEVINLEANGNAIAQHTEKNKTPKKTIASEYFGAEILDISTRLYRKTKNSAFELLTIIKGNITIETDNKLLHAQAGDSFFLPASLNWFILGGEGTLIHQYPG